MSNFYFVLFFSYCIWIVSNFILTFSTRKAANDLIKFNSLFFSLLQFFIILIVWLISSQQEIGNLKYTWTIYHNIYYAIQLDSISLLFLLLSFGLIPICILISWSNIKYRYSTFVFIMISISFFLFNIFCVLDLVFFYVFFESILIPMFLLIGIWGSRQRKIHAVYQFFFYTILGSLLMLLSILFIYSYAQTTDVRLLYHMNFSFNRQLVLWFCFFFAFAVKVPLFPFHIWLPEAHVEAPTIGSVLLAGVLLKMGSYGLLRFVIPLFNDANYFFLPFVYTLCIFGIVYTCCTTIRQVDLKKIIAYSSVSHMSFVILGLFSVNIVGIAGSIFLMLSHGIVSGGLFFLVGCIYDRFKTRILFYYSGLVNVMPLFAVLFFILILGNISFPGTSGFIGELLIYLVCLKPIFLWQWLQLLV